MNFEPCLIHDYLARNARQRPDKVALVTARERLTYRQLDRRARSFSAQLQQRGVIRQDRVAVLADNGAATVIAFFAALKAGAVAVILSSLLKARKLAYILEECQPRVLVTQLSRKAVVRAAGRLLNDGLPALLWLDELDPNASAPNHPDDHQPPRLIDRDLAALIYTSGSTGDPKAVMEPHANMLAAARSIMRCLENRADDIILSALPLSFNYGLYQVIMATMLGATLVLEESFAFPAATLERLKRVEATGFPLVPTMISLLMRLRRPQDYCCASVRYVTNTAGRLTEQHIAFLHDLFPRARVYSMYGLTECKRVSSLPPDQLTLRPASVGKPLANCEVKIVDERGNEVPAGRVGQLLVRGSNVMRGYWKDPELTSRVFCRDPDTHDVWLHTGDLFYRDDEGYLYFVERMDNLIKTRGERVAPAEIERLIGEMEAVLAVVVTGVPDPLWEQAVAAAICVKPGHQLSAARVRAFCAENLESFMVPKHVKFVEHFPVTANRKIDKAAVKRLFQAPEAE